MKNMHLILIAFLALALSACGGKKPTAPADQEATDSSRASATQLSLTTDQLKAADIELATVEQAKVRDLLPVYGVIAPNAERMRDVAARYAGMIRGVSRKIGDAVHQGDTLATVESNESLQSYSVVAPLSGVITARSANVGEQTGDKPLFVVADLSTVWVELSLFPRDAVKVHVGQPVRVRSPDVGYSADGRVTYVAPFGTSANQTLTARVELDNAKRQWAPGLYVTAEITLAEHAVPVAVRKTAIQTVDDAPAIFVRGATGFEARQVKLGRSDGDITEVLEGLRTGETYAARNSYVLKAEAVKREAAEE